MPKNSAKNVQVSAGMSNDNSSSNKNWNFFKPERLFRRP